MSARAAWLCWRCVGWRWCEWRSWSGPPACVVPLLPASIQSLARLLSVSASLRKCEGEEGEVDEGEEWSEEADMDCAALLGSEGKKRRVELLVALLRPSSNSAAAPKGSEKSCPAGERASTVVACMGRGSLSSTSSSCCCCVCCGRSVCCFCDCRVVSLMSGARRVEVSLSAVSSGWAVCACGCRRAA